MAVLVLTDTPLTLTYALLSLFFSYMIVGGAVNYFKLRHINGPPLAGFSRAWMFWQAVNGRMNKAQHEAIKKYGPVCRIGPNAVVTSDSDILRHISAPRSKWTRGEWYDSVKFDPRQDTVFSTRDERVHADLKAKEAGAYHGRDIDNLESDIDARTIEFIELIRSTYEGRSTDMAEIIRFYTLDVLSTVAFGKKFGFMEAKEDLWDYNKTVGQFLAVVELSANHRFFRRILSSSFMQALAAPRPSDKSGIGPAVGFAQKAVKERFGPDAKVKNDMLGHFVKKGLTQKQCEVEAFLQILAGSDSTTTILRCLIFTLASTPTAYMRLQAEIDSAIEAGSISYPVAQYAEVQKLPYLHACIWEAFRMYPPLFGLKAKLAPPEGETIKGVFFPGGTEIITCDEAVCQQERIFGTDAAIFRPERWIDANQEARLKYERTVDHIFGSGRWLCLGRNIAMMELHKAVVELMRHFDWAIADPYKGVPYTAHGAPTQTDMNMIARSR